MSYVFIPSGAYGQTAPQGIYSVNDGTCVSHFVKAWGNALGHEPVVWAIDPKVRPLAEGNCIRVYACRDKNPETFETVCKDYMDEFHRSLETLQIMMRKPNEDQNDNSAEKQ